MDGRTLAHTDAQIAAIPLRGCLPQIAGPQSTFSAVEFNYPLQLPNFLLPVSLPHFLYAFPPPFTVTVSPLSLSLLPL